MAEADKPVGQWPVFLDQKCHLCEINDMKFKCLNCNELICDSCKKIHLKSKMTKEHKVVCLETAEIYEGSETKTKCLTHQTEDLLMYCGTCKYPICRDCVTSRSHKNHQMVKIENVIDNKQKELSTLINQSKEKSSKCEDVLKTIDKNSREFSAAVSKEIDKVNARHDQLKCKLSYITTDCIQKLQTVDRENKKAMAELKQKVQRETTDLNQLTQQCEAKLRYKNIEMIQLVTDVTKKLDSYKQFDPPGITSPPKLITKDEDDQELVRLFGYLDSKMTTKVDPLLPQKRNIPSAIPAINVQVDGTFSNTNNCVVTVGNDQAWLWSRCIKGISLVTSDGKVIQSINTDFDLYDAVVSKSGYLLVTVWLGNKVKKLTANNTFTDIYTANGYETQVISVIDTGNVLVGLINFIESKIVEITTNRQQIRTIRPDIWGNKAVSIFTNINDDIIVIDNLNRVVSLNNSGAKRFIYDGKERNLKKLFNPLCVVTDKYGNIIITDYSNSLVHIINQDGKFLQYLITREHGCERPLGISIDSYGRLWVCNAHNDKVFIVKYL